MRRAYYSSSISNFLETNPDEILGELTRAHSRTIEQTQLSAWLEQINILKAVLSKRAGRLYFEYAIPRMGKRIDVLLLIGPVIFVLEFKVGESHFTSSALDQVTDYCLDLKNFHESSYDCFIAPVLVATTSRHATPIVCTTPKDDKLLLPIRSTVPFLTRVLDEVLSFTSNAPDIDSEVWERGRYCPTPTIIEAALALYKGHSVDDITRHEADKPDISLTTQSIDEIIRASRDDHFKSICFVTGVPGAGKTLVGLNTATKHQNKDDGLYSVFLSGNGPLVAILREALARDNIENEKGRGVIVKKGEARRRVGSFIQNVHYFRDECLVDQNRAPLEHVVLFDEAQRAWNLQQTSSFMLRKKSVPNFNISEPEFLISCLDRHPDWAVIVCLVGGGQEINTGEAGIGEWIEALNRSYPEWRIYISSRLTDSEYGAGKVLQDLSSRSHVTINENLHLAVSMRSFRAENVSRLVKQVLDLDTEGARQTLSDLKDRYPIIITRDLAKAKEWLKSQARGTERYGVVVSSQAERLKSYAIDVKTPVNPVDWFLNNKSDVRSSYYLEDVGTEFSVQGLELDWVCVTWDADLRHSSEGWQYWKFHGSRWMHVKQPHRQLYLKNSYRVLLTRARQGMVVVLPEGDISDSTRNPDFYNSTFEYLQGLGFTRM
jgi:DUF2075 family protein